MGLQHGNGLANKIDGLKNLTAAAVVAFGSLIGPSQAAKAASGAKATDTAAQKERDPARQAVIDAVRGKAAPKSGAANESQPEKEKQVDPVQQAREAEMLAAARAAAARAQGAQNAAEAQRDVASKVVHSDAGRRVSDNDTRIAVNGALADRAELRVVDLTDRQLTRAITVATRERTVAINQVRSLTRTLAAAERDYQRDMQRAARIAGNRPFTALIIDGIFQKSGDRNAQQAESHRQSVEAQREAIKRQSEEAARTQATLDRLIAEKERRALEQSRK